jgi:hypothetical protein
MYGLLREAYFVPGPVQAVEGPPSAMFADPRLCWPVEAPYPNAP